ncbi:MAG: glycosyltransferase family 2 protein [Candidatus Binataceae bacterium]
MKISIIIATHNRPASLQKLIESLIPQLRPDEMELFVAENGSKSRSPLPQAGMQLVHLHDAKPGKCRIQNRAIVMAHGEILVFLDDDLVAAPDYLDQVKDFFAGHPEFAAMKGRILPARDPVEAAGEMAPYLDLPIVDHGEKVVEVRGVIGANMAFRASAIRQAGLFDERLGPGAAGHEEETEMSARIRNAGFHIGYAPGAIVYHEVDARRAVRARFIRIARERGRCRVMHEPHNSGRVKLDSVIANARLAAARMLRAGTTRIAREEKRRAIIRGMLDGLRDVRSAERTHQSEPSNSIRRRP